MPSSVEKLATDLRAGGTVFSHWCGLPDPVVPGLLAREPGYGCVTIDMQHGAIDYMATARAIPMVVMAGRPCLPRIPVGDFATASRLLDAGASGIIAPMINSVEDARAFAAACKFPPIGERSWGPSGALLLTGTGPQAYFAEANDFVVTFAMIETREALGRIDDIMAVPGIDGVFIGPSDLSIGLSRGSSLSPVGEEVDAAIDHALRAAKAAGKLAGIYAMNGERAGDFARRGYHLVAIGSDVAFLRAGAAAMLKDAGGA